MFKRTCVPRCSRTRVTKAMRVSAGSMRTRDGRISKSFIFFILPQTARVTKALETRVARAAPVTPNFGMSREFRNMFMRTPSTFTKTSSLCLLYTKIAFTSRRIGKAESNMTIITRSTGIAFMYCGPNMKGTISSATMNPPQAIGKPTSINM